MTKAEIGKLGEDTAAKYLKKNGYKIIDRNKHQSHNEIDIIAADKNYIVFVEVKTRTTGKDLYSMYGTPGSAVDYAKQQRTVSAASAYLSQHFTEKQPRFDVIEIYLDKCTFEILNLNHIINAYGA